MKRSRLFIIPFLAALGWSADAAAQGQVTANDRVRRYVVVRTNPTVASPPIDALDPGESFELIAQLPDWFQIRLPDGRVGYVSRRWTVIRSGPDTEALTSAGNYRLHVIDVGTGLAIFVEGPDFTLVYDAGSQDDLAGGSRNRVVSYIHAVRPDVRVIDHLVLSHPHKDHVELMPDLFDAFEVRNVWDSGAVNQTRGYCRFLRAAAAEPNVRYHDAIASGGLHEVSFSSPGCSGIVRVPQAEQMSASPVRLGSGASMNILYRDATHHTDPNENSVVVRLDLGGRRVLLAGDAEAGERQAPSVPPAPRSIERYLLDNSRSEISADLLIVGHHGSLTSSRREFLDAVGARTFIISSGPHPYQSVRLPDAAVVAELLSRGTLFRTDIDDPACERAAAKVGPDNDGSPGGCSNIVVTFRNGQMSPPLYSTQAD